MIYCDFSGTRYEESAHNLGVIKQHLQNAQVIPDLILHLDGLLLYAGASRRAPGIKRRRMASSRKNNNNNNNNNNNGHTQLVGDSSLSV